MGRSRSRSPVRRERRRSRERDRLDDRRFSDRRDERRDDRKDDRRDDRRKERRRRSKSRSPGPPRRRRSRSFSPGSSRRRSRSRSRDRNRDYSSNGMDNDVIIISQHPPLSQIERAERPPMVMMERPEIDESQLVGKSEEEVEMMKLMGFDGFESTKGKQVEGNNIYVASIQRKRRYRQYMNRRGGFNRPLDFIA